MATLFIEGCKQTLLYSLEGGRIHCFACVTNTLPGLHKQLHTSAELLLCVFICVNTERKRGGREGETKDGVRELPLVSIVASSAANVVVRNV